MSTTRELFGNGITIGSRRWFLDRYGRISWANPRRWFVGPITDPYDGRRVGTEVCGPRHGLALFHTGTP